MFRASVYSNFKRRSQVLSLRNPVTMQNIDPTDKSAVVSTDPRYTCLSLGQSIENYYLAFVPEHAYSGMPAFGVLEPSSCFSKNFFQSEESQFGLVMLFSQMCNCTSTVFYLPVTLFQYITDRLLMEKMWECYYAVYNGLEEERTICVQNWKTSTFFNLVFRQQHEHVQLCLSYTNSFEPHRTPRYRTNALDFLDYCQFFYRRFVNPVLETNNYVYEYKCK